jgi:hypothetical protein
MPDRYIRPSIRFAALSLALAAASCTLGPDYKRPIVTVPSAYRGADAAQGLGSLADTRWFDLFQDQTLTRLVQTALRQNFDVRIAAERVLQARARFGIVRSERFPSVDASVAETTSRFSRAGTSAAIPPGADRDVTYTQAGFSVGWELDVWGRLKRLNESARAQYLATGEARRGVVTTLVADVTETYLGCGRSTSSCRSRGARATRRPTACASPRRGAIAGSPRRSTCSRPTSCCTRPARGSPASNATSRRRRTRSACSSGRYRTTFRAASSSKR